MEPHITLIQQLDDSRAKMQALLNGIDPERKIYPPWTIKQILAHITGWDEATTTALRAHHVNNKEPGTPAARGIDYYNAQSVAEREALPYPHIIKEWHHARAELKTMLANLPAEKFDEPLLFPWGQTGTVEQIVHIMVEHEIEHAAEISELLKLKPEEAPPASETEPKTAP